MSRYTGIIRGKWIMDGSKTIDEMVDNLIEQVNELRAMRDAGIVLDSEVDDDYAHISTDDPKVAKQFGLTLDEESGD